MTKFKFTKFGISEDPRGAQVAWQIKGRRYLADVIGFYHNEITGCIMLKVQYFCGDMAPDVAASFVEIIGWSGEALHRSVCFARG